MLQMSNAKHQTRKSAGLAALLALLLCGCSTEATTSANVRPAVVQASPTPPEDFLPALGQARALPVIPLRIDLDGQVPADQWPDACDVLPKAAVQALLPSALAITQAGEKGKFLDGTLTKKNTYCAYTVRLRDTKNQTREGSVELALRAVADPRLLTASHAQREREISSSTRRKISHYHDYDRDFDADCFFGGFALECLAGPVEFQVLGAAPRASTKAATDAEAKTWQNDVLGAVAAQVAARFP